MAVFPNQDGSNSAARPSDTIRVRASSIRFGSRRTAGALWFAGDPTFPCDMAGKVDQGKASRSTAAVVHRRVRARPEVFAILVFLAIMAEISVTQT